MDNKKINLRTLLECAIMLGLSFALSFVKLYPAPLGGSVTAASAVPICLIAFRHGSKIGLFTAGLYGILQLIQGANNLSYGTTFAAVLAIVLFDYVLAFLPLGLVGIFRGKNGGRLQSAVRFSSGALLSMSLRFLCHLVSGAVVWFGLTKGWYEEKPEHIVHTLPAWGYSAVYNLQYMIPEIIITVVVCAAVAFSLNLRNDKLRYEA